MKNDDTSLGKAPGDDIDVAFENMRSVIDQCEYGNNLEWRIAAKEILAFVRELARSYVDEMKTEAETISSGEKLHKDHPVLNPRKKDPGFPNGRPVRKANRKPGEGIDPAHTIEIQLAKKFEELVSDIDISVWISSSQRIELKKALLQCADALAHNGICLEQKQTFAAKTTMPKASEEHPDALKVSEQKGRGSIFKRLRKYTDDNQRSL